MLWYGGSMVEAVNLSKQRNAIFVVFIEGENDLSAELAATIENQVVVKKLSDEDNFLAVKLKSGSENYTHFAKIYQFVPVPSLFFIGRNGTPLEVVCAGVEPQNLAERIDRILDQHYKEKRIQPSTSGQNIRQQTASLLQAESTSNPPAATASQPAQLEVKPVKPSEPAKRQQEDGSKADEPLKPNEAVEPETSASPPKVAKTEHREVTRSGQEYDVVCDGDVCVRRPRSSPEPGPSQRDDGAAGALSGPEVQTSPSAFSMEEKLEHAKEIIEARRREKALKEKELEKEKEQERRATGQGVAELKRWQAEQEMKQFQEERKREKMENNLARQRILAQIAQDRAERRARDQPAAPPAEPPAAAPPAAEPPAPHDATRGDAAAAAGGARLQFKLPDGSPHTAHFDANASLAAVHQYVASNLQMSTSSFSLWTAFPRRELPDTEATLLQLQLAPSAAVLVMPRRTVQRPVASRSFITFIAQFFTSIIVNPTYAVYSWLRDRLFPAAATPPATTPTPSAGPAAPPAPNTPDSGLRRRGNIHRLTGDRGSDDDNNTWNGNSTQQM